MILAERGDEVFIRYEEWQEQWNEWIPQKVRLTW